MSRFFQTVIAAVPEIIALSFMDDNNFLTCSRSAQDIAKMFQLVRKKIIELG